MFYHSGHLGPSLKSTGKGRQKEEKEKEKQKEEKSKVRKNTAIKEQGQTKYYLTITVSEMVINQDTDVSFCVCVCVCTCCSFVRLYLFTHLIGINISSSERCSFAKLLLSRCIKIKQTNKKTMKYLTIISFLQICCLFFVLIVFFGGRMLSVE